MKTTNQRPNREAKIDARVSTELRLKIERIAVIREVEMAEIIRQALREYTARFETQAVALAAA